nr:hypothetical protein [Gammaproteobacteria bacterium]
MAVSAAETPPYEQRSTATAPFTSVRVLDVERMPLERGQYGSTNWGTRTLWRGPNGNGTLRILYVPPGAQGAYVHYHTFHEWAYNIQGDFTNNESTNPLNVSGPVQRFREGYFLSRPPYSLHGGERGRMPHMMSQIGAVILIMEESGVWGETFAVDPAVEKDPSLVKHYGFDHNYKQVKHWSTPRIIDTIDKMPWQPVEGVPGLNAKYLIDDPAHGFRARMWFLEAGAQTPEMLLPHYYKQAHQFNFVINGDLKLQAYANEKKPAETLQLDKHFFFERPPMAIVGVAPGVATEYGAVWLEVTYAKGTAWTKEPTDIEDPIYVNK